jgi:hypothetical protein
MQKLAIISVPYLRVARTLLNNHVLQALADADVLVVSPFADDPSFRVEYGRPGVEFLKVAAPDAMPRPFGIVYGISEVMRMQGYWRRHRRAGLGYQWRTASLKFSNDGNDAREPLVRRIAHSLLAYCGTWPKSWRLLDKLVASTLFRCPMLESIVRRYSAVTLVQASSWGFVDRLLASNARRFGFRTVLLPYTTDQLWVNGFLLCDYDAVCVQGPFEHECARRFHGLPESRIIKMGSIWFRTIDDFVARNGLGLRSEAGNRQRTVTYAGVSSTYFPRGSEFKAVEALIAEMQAGRFGDAKLFYRPYPTSAEDRAEIEAAYGNRHDIELQWPEEACAGLDSYSGERIEPQLLQYLRRLANVDVLVMSHTTSLGWDAAYLGSAVVANFADDSGVLERRQTYLRFSEQRQLDCAPGMPVAFSIEELVRLVELQLKNPVAAAQSRHQWLAQW